MLSLHSYAPQLENRLMTKPTKWHVSPAKTQTSLGIRPVWSEPSLCAQWVAKDPSFLHADSEDPDQTGPMPRLIWVFAGHTCHFVGFVMRWLLWFWCTIYKSTFQLSSLSPSPQKKNASLKTGSVEHILKFLWTRSFLANFDFISRTITS